MATTYESGAYSFQDVTCSIAGPNINVIVTGAAEEGYSVEFEGDKVTTTMGADGGGQHSVHAAQNGTLTLRLRRTALLNQALMNAFNFQNGSAANAGRNTILIDDPIRGDTITCLGCAFRRIPNLTYANDAGTNEWSFNCIRIEPNLGPGVETLLNG